MASIQRFFAWQVKVSRSIDRACFKAFSVDGNEAFTQFVGKFVANDATVADIGGGKTPFFSSMEVSRRNIRVVGVDMSASELESAERGCYAELRIGRIEEVKGNADNDFVIAQSVLEHVTNGREAATGMASFLRPGGSVVTFCPNKRAWFARLNVLIPERLKRAILFYVFPSKRERQGFPAFYDGCCPGEMVTNMREAGVKMVQIQHYFTSSYFMFFVPLYIFWRVLTFPLMWLWPNRYCETFIFVGEKIEEPLPGIRYGKEQLK